MGQRDEEDLEESGDEAEADKEETEQYPENARLR